MTSDGTSEDTNGGETVQVEIPKEVIEKSDGYVTVVASPTSEKNAQRFEEWVGASGFPDDVWMLLNSETGEIDECETL